MSDNLRVDFDHAANAGVLRYLKSRERFTRLAPSVSPESVADPYFTLGTHPDLVERLWDKLGKTLPEDCRWVVYGTPTLVHPKMGIVFGFAAGTLPYALRLPEPELREAKLASGKRVHEYAGGSTLDLDEIGEEWVFGGWFADEERWCGAAYRFAGA